MKFWMHSGVLWHKAFLERGQIMKYSNVVVAGGGVLGSQIAFQAAYCGFNVTIWLRSEGSIGRR